MGSQNAHIQKVVLQVCLHCGSIDPDEIAPDCTHPRVARFQEVSPVVTETITKIRRAVTYQREALRFLADTAVIEAAAGRAVVDEHSETYAPPENVVFLRPRGELVRRDDETPTATPSKSTPSSRPAPAVSGPALELRAPTPTPPRRRRAAPPRPKREDESTPALFETPSPSTDERP